MFTVVAINEEKMNKNWPMKRQRKRVHTVDTSRYRFDPSLIKKFLRCISIEDWCECNRSRFVFHQAIAVYYLTKQRLFTYIAPEISCFFFYVDNGCFSFVLRQRLFFSHQTVAVISSSPTTAVFYFTSGKRRFVFLIKERIFSYILPDNSCFHTGKYCFVSILAEQLFLFLLRQLFCFIWYYTLAV